MLIWYKDNMQYQELVFSSLVLVVGTAFLFLVLSRIFTKETKRTGEIPGRLGLPFLGDTFSLIAATKSPRGTYDFVRTQRLRYGSWFKTRIFGKIHVYIPSIEGAKKVFSNDMGLFDKKFVKSIAVLLGKKSLFVVQKFNHERIRRLISEPLSMNSVSKLVPELHKMVSEKLKKMQKEGKSFRMLQFTMKLVFDTTCNALMSITDASLLDQMEKDCKTVYDGMLTLPIKIPGTRYYKAIKARERLMDIFKSIIAERRNRNESRDDFLQSMLMRDSNPAEGKLEDVEIMDNILSMMLVGQSHTATAMMWSVKYLSDNPQVLDMLREEQLSILGDMPDSGALTYEDLAKMSFASKVVKETLRMTNIVQWFPRIAANDCTIEGYDIKKGWRVNVDACHIHYDPDVHKDPTRFDPSRFDEMPKPYAYMPFGAGPRSCVAINMVKVTMMVFLHCLTSGYTWTVDDQDPSFDCKGVAPKLKSGLPVTLTPIY